LPGSHSGRPRGAGDRVARLNRSASEVFGWPALRPEQVEAIEGLLDGRDVLAVLATGSGKSAIFEVPALERAGLIVVISPLIALQHDQISGLARTSAPAAVAINSRQRVGDNDAAWRAIDEETARFVFLGPEQLANDEVVERLGAHRVALVAVDEAHCVSAWGHDFRPDYLRIADAIERLGRPPVAALTATASPLLRDEIVERLRLRDPVIVTGDFDRPNIALTVRTYLDDDAKRAAVVDTVTGMDGPGLLYCATRKDAEGYAEQLVAHGIAAVPYHAALRTVERDQVHDRFQRDQVSVVAATSAFGMGIDKPNVRFVVHASTPDSMDSYYQQIGRAGRDGEPAEATLFYRSEDLSLGRFFAATGLDEDLVRNVYSALSATTPKRLKDIRTDVGRRGRALTQALNLLEQAGFVSSGRRGFIATGGSADQAVEGAREVAATTERIDKSRVEMVRAYAEGGGCRRQHLLAYFGDHLDEPCGNCDLCRGEEQTVGAGTTSTAPPAIPVDTRVEHREWGGGVVLEGDDERITALFDEYGYRTLSIAAVRQNELLTVVEDTGT
jgi:ATP-dependent DNA helicase RecQ